jgi:hypothetical protein
MPEHYLITKPGMLSRPTDLDGLRRLMAVKTSESEIGGNDRKPDEDDGREGRPLERDCYILIENG